jgi:hypothetical protein
MTREFLKTNFTFRNGATAACAAEALCFQKVLDWSGLAFESRRFGLDFGFGLSMF